MADSSGLYSLPLLWALSKPHGDYDEKTIEDIDQTLAGLLRMAEHNELEEYKVVYKAFGDKAKEEGFTAVAYAFYQIAEIEKSHAERFGRYAQWAEQERLFPATFACSCSGSAV